jgi:hypothetical protein
LNAANLLSFDLHFTVVVPLRAKRHLLKMTETKSLLAAMPYLTSALRLTIFESSVSSPMMSLSGPYLVSDSVDSCLSRVAIKDVARST